MNNLNYGINAAQMNKTETDNQDFDYSHVNSIARIATYDDLKSAPRVTTIEPTTTDQFIMNMATKTYEQAKLLGGNIPFTIIKEVSENFIHARFEEITISILDGGNTIRFADQGPGIDDKEKVQLPGFSSAVEPMKQYIRGVGSGLPIVKDYFNEKHGSVTIDDNVLRGAVVTISLKNDSEEPQEPAYATEQQYAEHEQYPRQQYQTSGIAQVNNQSTNQTPYPYQVGNQVMNPYQTANQIYVGTNGRVPLYIPEASNITERGKKCLEILLSEGTLGVTEIAELIDAPTSSVHAELQKLEQADFVQKTAGRKRTLTPIGKTVAMSI